MHVIHWSLSSSYFFSGHKSAVSSLSFDSHGTRLVSGSRVIPLFHFLYVLLNILTAT